MQEGKKMTVYTHTEKKKGIGQTLSSYAAAMVPRFIPNKMLLTFLDILCRLQRFLPDSGKRHLRKNDRAFLRHLPVIRDKNGYIEDQGTYADLHYGKVHMAYAGCEIIAVYNALRFLSPYSHPSLPALIRDFEKDGMVLSGHFGTSPKALARYLKILGHTVEIATDESAFPALTDSCTCLLLTYYNDKRDIFKEIHTICLTKEKDGWHAHNLYCDGKPVIFSENTKDFLSEINGGQAKGIAMIGISG